MVVLRTLLENYIHKLLFPFEQEKCGFRSVCPTGVQDPTYKLDCITGKCNNLGENFFLILTNQKGEDRQSRHGQ